MAESELGRQLARDLDGAFENLVLELQGPVYRFAYRWCGNSEDAEEIAQDAFVRAYQALQHYEPERIAELKLTSWLLAIAINLTRNRARKKRLPIHDLAAVDEPCASVDEQPEHISERHELADLLVCALAELPPRYRTAVILRHVIGFDYDEIAMALDQPPGTVKSNVHRGVRRLRERLIDLEPRSMTITRKETTNDTTQR